MGTMTSPVIATLGHHPSHPERWALIRYSAATATRTNRNRALATGLAPCFVTKLRGEPELLKSNTHRFL